MNLSACSRIQPMLWIAVCLSAAAAFRPLAGPAFGTGCCRRSSSILASPAIDPERNGQALSSSRSMIAIGSRTHRTVLRVSPSTDNDADDSAVASMDNNQSSAGSDAELQNLLTQGGAVLVGFVLFYGIGTSALTMATGMASSAASAVNDELIREAGNVWNAMASLFTLIVSVVWEGARILLPALFKAVSAGVEAASPVVQQYSQAAYEAATPYVDEATSKLSEAAAPYVEQVNTAVDTTIVAPLSSAVDNNLVAPLKEATGSVTNAVDASLRDATKSVTDAVDANVVGPLTSAVDANLVAPIKEATGSVSSAVDSTIQGATSSVTSTIDSALKEASGSVSGAASQAKQDVTSAFKGVLPF